MNDAWRRAGALLLWLLASVPLAAAQGVLLPVDQAAEQPDFLAFRTRLQDVVARRDAPALLNVVHRDIRSSFGGNGGVDEFRQMWDLPPGAGRLWEELARVLALGGSFGRDGAFTAPYTFSRWPERLDAYRYLAIVGTGVRVRAKPNRAAEPLTSLAYAIVEEAGSTPADGDWVAVRVPGGRVGYVDRRYVRSPIDYRASFVKEDGRWQMTLFIAGD